MAKFLGGLLPSALGGAFGKENRGFGLGLLPGLLYKDYYKDKQGEKEEEKRRMLEAMAASNADQQSTKIIGAKKGGKVKKMAKGGSVSSASKRADGCAQRGKTKGKMV